VSLLLWLADLFDAAAGGELGHLDTLRPGILFSTVDI
jgi:hypothetical protein